MKFTVYRTTNLIDGKFYIGVHQTSNQDDHYLGSGKWIRRAIKKYGAENFVKEVLYSFDSKEEAYTKEKQLVTEEVLNSGSCYNLKIGGEGGWDFARKSLLDKFPNGVQYGRTHSKETKSRISNSRTGLIATEETKMKMSLALKGKYVGEKSKGYGTKWISNGIEEKQISKSENLPAGWQYGRVRFSKEAKENMAKSRIGNTNARKLKAADYEPR
jgi:group I intron endonuclease